MFSREGSTESVFSRGSAESVCSHVRAVLSLCVLT